MIERGADVNVVNQHGNTPLICACYKGNVELAHLLIERGADVNFVNQHGNTPLICACNEGNVELAHLLIERGADVNVVNEGGNIPLVHAQGFHNEEIIGMLMQVQNSLLNHQDASCGKKIAFIKSEEGSLLVKQIYIVDLLNENIDLNELRGLFEFITFNHLFLKDKRFIRAVRFAIDHHLHDINKQTIYDAFATKLYSVIFNQAFYENIASSNIIMYALKCNFKDSSGKTVVEAFQEIPVDSDEFNKIHRKNKNIIISHRIENSMQNFTAKFSTFSPLIQHYMQNEELLGLMKKVKEIHDLFVYRLLLPSEVATKVIGFAGTDVFVSRRRTRRVRTVKRRRIRRRHKQSIL